MMRYAWIVAAALGAAGCTPEKTCDNHRALDAAEDSAGREDVRKKIEDDVEKTLSLARMGLSGKKIPQSDCPRCDKLIERALMVGVGPNR